MTIAILSALPEEQQGLVELLQNAQQLSHAGRRFWRGTLHGVDVICALSGIGKVLADSLAQLNMNPIVLAWLVAGLMHFAVGSATVAMISAAGMVLPMLNTHPGVSREIMVIAIGAGAIGWTHVTDSAFWVVKEYLGASLTDALKKFTAGTVLASLVALGLTLLLAKFV